MHRRARNEGRSLRRAPSVGTETITPRDKVEPGLDLAFCIPSAILGSIREGAHEPEHRLSTVAFVHFDGTDALLESVGPEGTAEYMDVLIRDVQGAVDNQGVTFIGTDIDRARPLGGGPQLPLLHRVRGVALFRSGQREPARSALGESLAAARARQVDYEAALTLGVMGALDFGSDGRSRELLAEESKRVLASLGVVWVPDLLAEPD